MKKEVYSKPVAEIIRLNEVDVITTSGSTGGSTGGGFGGGLWPTEPGQKTPYTEWGGY